MITNEWSSFVKIPGGESFFVYSLVKHPLRIFSPPIETLVLSWTFSCDLICWSIWGSINTGKIYENMISANQNRSISITPKSTIIIHYINIYQPFWSLSKYWNKHTIFKSRRKGTSSVPLLSNNRTWPKTLTGALQSSRLSPRHPKGRMLRSHEES